MTDLDRTFTRADLSLSADAVARALELQQAGIVTVLATGRALDQVPLQALSGAFDAMVLEGGAAWGQPGDWSRAPVPAGFWELAAAIGAAGFAVERAWSSFSAPAAALPVLAGSARLANVRRNRDRIDVTPPGVDKASGVAAALARMGTTDPWILAVGDAANDVPLAHAAAVSVAVANAEAELLQVATLRAPHEADRGFLWAVARLGNRGGEA